VYTWHGAVRSRRTDWLCRSVYRALSHHLQGCYLLIAEEERARLEQVCGEALQVAQLAARRAALGCSLFVGTQELLGLEESEFEGFVLRFVCPVELGVLEFKRSVS
jgi:hypothetical protein